MGIAKQHLTHDEREQAARGLFEVTDHDEAAGELHGLCPIHDEKNASFSYNYIKDQFYCLSCTKSGDLCRLWCKVNGHDDQAAGFKLFCHHYGIDTGRPDTATARPMGATPPPAGDNLEAVWKKFPPLPSAWVDRLAEIRGWTAETLAARDIRLQTYFQKRDTGKLVKIHRPERVAIPIRDKIAKLQNIRLYKPGATEMKIISWGKGYGKARLYPAEPAPGGTVLLCEGEQDTLCAISHGFNAITQTSKRKTWPKSHKAPFKGRDVVICYDADVAGQKYAGFAAEALAGIAASVKLLTWPDYMGREDDGTWPKDHGQDLTDYFVTHKMAAQDLASLVDAALPAAGDDDGPPGYLRFFEMGASGRYSYKPILLVDQIKEEMDLLYEPESEILYQWNDRYYEPFHEIHIKRRCQELLEIESNRNRLNDAVDQVKVASGLKSGRQLNDQEDWLCLANCMLNIRTWSTQRHDKSFHATVSLAAAYDPDENVTCPQWIEYLEQTIQTPEAIAQAQEFAGLCMTRDTKFAKCLLLVGPGSDGKSIFLKILQKLVGPENTSAVSFQDLEDQFIRASVYGKLLNISTEVGNKALQSPYFKAIVTGDPINAAFKHQTPFEFRPFCKLAFAANRLPRVLDNSDGFFRRLLPIQFKRQFLEGDPATNPDLEEKLEAELPGILKWALAGRRRLVKQGRFTSCPETNELMMGYRRLNNPVTCYTEDRCDLDSSLESSKADLYQDYVQYCAVNGYKKLNNVNFFQELRASINTIQEYRPIIEGKRQRVVQGIGIRPSADPPGPLDNF